MVSNQTNTMNMEQNKIIDLNLVISKKNKQLLTNQ